MRSQLVNWFLLSIAISDLCVLIFSFFVFSLPLMAEYFEDEDLMLISPKLLVDIYPFALISHTTSVYLTILVSVHRYLGVCHPFLIRRISSKSVVKFVIASALVFSVFFNLPRFFEIQTVDCHSEIFGSISSMVVPTLLFNERLYTILYRNACYTVVMFFFPFAMLTWVNYKIVSTLKTSNNGAADGVEGVRQRKEHGITVMLVAMVTGFLLFNMLAFFNNILELTGEYSESYTFLIELSTLLVNLNGATTIIIYLAFGTKYRNVFLKVCCCRNSNDPLKPRGFSHARERSSSQPTASCYLSTLPYATRQVTALALRPTFL
ncbi:hypothetical protein FO519_007587 [Halicephalobus sp. NKZ332]|nr:hypothetical protein FO519_007587 [Halicephalobus sp. NKZ332]